jgi:hypothetical protein
MQCTTVLLADVLMHVLVVPLSTSNSWALVSYFAAVITKNVHVDPDWVAEFLQMPGVHQPPEHQVHCTRGQPRQSDCLHHTSTATQDMLYH